MGKDWRFGQKTRCKLSAPRTKKYRIKNLQLIKKKSDINNSCNDQVIIKNIYIIYNNNNILKIENYLVFFYFNCNRKIHIYQYLKMLR